MFAGKTLRVCALSCLVVLGFAHASLGQPIRRVPAEFEPQEAIWLQWPGRWEKTYEPAFAQITNVIVQYETVHILYDSNRIRDEARTAISNTNPPGNPDPFAFDPFRFGDHPVYGFVEIDMDDETNAEEAKKKFIENEGRDPRRRGRIKQ